MPEPKKAPKKGKKPIPSSPKKTEGELSDRDLDKVSGGAGSVPARDIPDGDPGLL